ncbi:MAG: hypothetical protein WDZ80_01645 [Candidatus Paceibacterota bacterium]
MKENFNPKNFEEEKSPENQEKENREKLLEIVNEEEEILKDIDKAFSSMEDRQSAEELIMEKYAPILGDSIKESSEIFNLWMESLKKRLNKEDN